MSRKKQLATVAGTFAAAMGIGYFVQNGDANASLATDTAQVQAQEDVTVQTASVLPELPQAPAEPDINAGVLVASVEIATDVATAPIVNDVNQDVAELACEAVLTATSSPAAMVTLSLDAPCQTDVRATIHHQGMHFTQLTDADGRFNVDIPALAEASIFIVAFPNGEGAMANTMVPSVSEFDRVVLQSKDLNGIDIHAREFGANYGEAGHIWKEAAGLTDDAVAGTGGFMTLLGDDAVADGSYVQIYSYPSAATQNFGQIDLTIEAQVTSDNCNQPVSAETMQITGGIDATVREFELEMPDCDAVGDFLVLNNLYENLKLAQN